MLLSNFQLGLLLGLISLTLYFCYQSFFVIEQGHVGIITYFGKAQTDANNKLILYPSGSHLKWPWGKIYQQSMMEQIFDLHDGGGKTALAYDGTVLQLEAKLRYRPSHHNLYDYLFKLKNPVDHVKGLFTSLLRYQIANFKGDDKNEIVSSYASLRKERKLLNNELDKFCHDNLKGRYGIDFQSIDLIDILPPAELDQALNAVLNAHVEADAMFSRAEADCAQKKLAAQVGVEIEESKAQAIGLEILTLGKYLAELEEAKTLTLYIERRKCEVLYDTKNIFIKGAV
ncbi:MAG: SPFH domain-containing protein [Bacteriovoracaceae bacterium]